MKKLLQKIITPVVASAAILIPRALSAQEKTGEFKQHNYVSIGIGSYLASAREMRDIYGEFSRIRAGFGKELSKNFRLEGALSYSKKEGEPYISAYGDWDYLDSKSDMNMLSLELLGKYVFSGKTLNFYFGAGLTAIRFKEKLDVQGVFDGQYLSDSQEGTESVFGPVFVLGADMPINKSKTAAVYGEVSGRSANTKGATGMDLDLGGSALEVGVKFFVD